MQVEVGDTKVKLKKHGERLTNTTRSTYNGDLSMYESGPRRKKRKVASILQGKYKRCVSSFMPASLDIAITGRLIYGISYPESKTSTTFFPSR